MARTANTIIRGATLELIKFEVGDGYVEIEINEATKSEFASLRRKTQFEEAAGERAFIERAVARLDALGRIEAVTVGERPSNSPKFEKAQQAGRNGMRFVQALYRWNLLTYYTPRGEWSLFDNFLRGNDGSDWVVSLWPRGYFSDVEVKEDV